MSNPTSFPDRAVAAVGGGSLLAMAVLAPIAFSALHKLVLPADAATTVENLRVSEALFRSGIAAFLVVILLDVVVAWALYVVLEPVHGTHAVGVAWLRVAYAAAFAAVLPHLLDAVHVAAQAAPTDLQRAQAMASLASFSHGFDLALAVFGLHLLALGFLLWRATFIPRWLSALVVIGGGGYLFDAFGKILVPGYGLAVSEVTFVGEALLIIWFFVRAVRGFPPVSERVRG